MFATKNDNKKKTPAAQKPERPDAARGGKDAASHNPIWQALAMTPDSAGPKLVAGQPGDADEREADRTAERIMRMATPRTGVSELSSARAAHGEARRARDRRADEEVKEVRRKERAGTAVVENAPPIVREALGSPWHPLDAGARDFFEPRFGQDLGHVRVHVGGVASESAESVNALAYTVGSDIVFGEGQYRPARG